jgi:hypothetical protein
MHMRGSSLIAAVIRHLLDAADTLEHRAMNRAAAAAEAAQSEASA